MGASVSADCKARVTLFAALIIIASSAVTASGQGFFARGDNDCDDALDAADIVASLRAVDAAATCDNSDCNRDHQVTAADALCAAQCVFGDCPQIPDAPIISTATPETTATIIPLSVLLLTGTNFGTSSEFTQVTVGNLPAEVIEHTAPDRLRIVVPAELAPGPVDVVVIRADIEGAPFRIEIGTPTPIGSPDRLEDLFDLLDLAIDALLALDLDGALGAEAATVRDAAQQFRDSLSTERAAIAADPEFSAEQRARVDALVDSSGLPELLRRNIAELENAAGNRAQTRLVPRDGTIIIQAVRNFGGTIAVSRGLLATLNPFLQAGGLALGLGVLTGVLLGLGSGGAAPILVSISFVTPTGLPSKYAWGGGTAEVRVKNIKPNDAALFINTPKPHVVLPSRVFEDGIIEYPLPGAMDESFCGRVEMNVFDVQRQLGTPLIGVHVQPQLAGVAPADDARIGGKLELNTLGGLSCVHQTLAQFSDTDGHHQASSAAFRGKRIATTVPDIPLGASLVRVSVAGVQSYPQPVTITGVKEFTFGCAVSELFVPPAQPSATLCVAEVKPTELATAFFPSVRWSSSDTDVGTIERPITFSPFESAFRARRPGMANVTATLSCSQSHICDGVVKSGVAAMITVKDKTAPTISLTSDPPAGDVPAGSSIEFTVAADDNVAPSALSLIPSGDAVGGGEQGFNCSLVDSHCETTFTLQLKSTDFSNRSVSVSASAVDSAGNKSTSTALIFKVGPPDTTPPVVRITQPADGATVAAGATVQVFVHVSDNAQGDSGVKKINVTASGDAVASAPMPESVCLPMPIAEATRVVPFTVKNGADLAAVADRQIIITAQAFDASGSTCDDGNASEVQTITVKVGAPPMITSVTPQVNAGDLLTIEGSGFGSAQGNSTVTIGGTLATANVWSDGQLVVTVPSMLSGANLPVVVTVDGIASNIVTTTVLGTGDVQVTLDWHDTNDLDLHVIDPSGEEIYYASRGSASGGMLDVDANMTCHGTTSEPKENVFWPAGAAPRGEYHVRVAYFEGCTDPNTASAFDVWDPLESTCRHASLSIL